MNQDYILRRGMSLSNILDTIPDGILTIRTTVNYAFQFCYTKLFRICPKYIMPTFKADNRNRINIRMILKSFQCVYYYRFIIDIDELLWYILLHPLTDATCNDQCYIRVSHLRLSSSYK